jgi:hypothetical protein
MTTVYTPVPELLIVEGRKTRMIACPPIPADHPRIRKATKMETIRAVIMFDGRHCSRGYQATWEIKSGRLYLKELTGRIQLKKGRPVLARWFSGALRVPKRSSQEYVRSGFAAIRSGRAVMAFEKGVAVPADRIGEYEITTEYGLQTTKKRLADLDLSSCLLEVLNPAARSRRKATKRPQAAKGRILASRKKRK